MQKFHRTNVLNLGVAKYTRNKTYICNFDFNMLSIDRPSKLPLLISYVLYWSSMQSWSSASYFVLLFMHQAIFRLLQRSSHKLNLILFNPKASR